MVRLFAPLALIICTIPALGQGTFQVPGEIQQPKGKWQIPGEIRRPKGPWQQPGDIQVPKGIQAVRVVAEDGCTRRLAVVADALFEFDRANLNPAATETLVALGPEIQKTGAKPIAVEGHTDALGSDAYNQKLSEARAKSVRDWLAEHQFVPPALAIKGYGKTHPVAANKKPDGSDDPEGRQKNRRVEIVVSACS
jgi:outer membrane protein OmpA-like peptidoglycan-associated protein